jgi:hypothetical protein
LLAYREKSFVFCPRLGAGWRCGLGRCGGRRDLNDGAAATRARGAIAVFHPDRPAADRDAAGCVLPEFALARIAIEQDEADGTSLRLPSPIAPAWCDGLAEHRKK